MATMSLEKEPELSVKEAELLSALIEQHDHAIEEHDIAHPPPKQPAKGRRRSSVTQFIAAAVGKFSLRRKKGPEFKYFFHLPIEIRDEIYAYALTTRKDLVLDPADEEVAAGLTPALLRTCRQVYKEAAPILYKHNHLVLRKSLVHGIHSKSSVALARHLEFRATDSFLVLDKPENLSKFFGGFASTLYMRNMRSLKISATVVRTIPFDLLSEYVDMDDKEKGTMWTEGGDLGLLETAAGYWEELHRGLKFEGLRFKNDELTGNLYRGNQLKVYVTYEMNWSGFRAEEKVTAAYVAAVETMMCERLICAQEKMAE